MHSSTSVLSLQASDADAAWLALLLQSNFNGIKEPDDPNHMVSLS